MTKEIETRQHGVDGRSRVSEILCQLEADVLRYRLVSLHTLTDVRRDAASMVVLRSEEVSGGFKIARR